MKTRPYPYGTNVKDMVSFFGKIGWTVESSLKADKFSRYDDFKDFVWYHLEKGRPILVEFHPPEKRAVSALDCGLSERLT